jgi:hypothetical protein
LDDLIGLLLWATILGFYLIPTLVAWSHEHHHQYAIVFLKRAVRVDARRLGWHSGIHWIGARP